jgi:exodeoxyribonuclease-3
VQIGIPGFEDEQKRAIAATVGDVRIVNLYVVNGQDVGTDKYAYKLRWLEAVRGWLADELARHPKLVVLGDFNIAPDDRDVHDPAVWNDEHILTSTAERDALRALLGLGLHDAFRLHHDEADVFSWWDYRAAGFRRNLGLRIDLTLVSDALRAPPAKPASTANRAPGSAPATTPRHGCNWLEPQRRKARHCAGPWAPSLPGLSGCSCG